MSCMPLKNPKDISALKAVSQNLMHSKLSITDGVYGILSENDIRGEITNLENLKETVEIKNFIPKLKEIVNKLDKEKQNKNNF